tara:strand:- start:160 stop:321 length:162 start_codon:yes stop_codon:yes gene_type:complete
MTLEELIEKIKREYDPELVLEALEIDIDELLDRFEDKLILNLHKFTEETTDYE